MPIKNLLIALIAVLCIAAPASAAPEPEAGTPFMTEFAGLAEGILNNEAQIRDALGEFIVKHKDKLKEGFGSHPELLPEMYGLAGLTRVQCIRGKYFNDLHSRLTNREREAFLDASHRLDWWVMQLAMEEADRLGVYKSSPPLSYRRPVDFPRNIALDILEDIKPYLESAESTDISFSGLICE